MGTIESTSATTVVDCRVSNRELGGVGGSRHIRVISEAGKDKTNVKVGYVIYMLLIASGSHRARRCAAL